jgi:hypothetical protein
MTKTNVTLMQNLMLLWFAAGHQGYFSDGDKAQNWRQIIRKTDNQALMFTTVACTASNA